MYLDGKLTPFYKTETVLPFDENEDIHKLASRNFHEYVFDTSFDSLVILGGSKCTTCPIYKKMYKHVARELKLNPNILVFFMNTTLNEVDDIEDRSGTA